MGNLRLGKPPFHISCGGTPPCPCRAGSFAPSALPRRTESGKVQTCLTLCLRIALLLRHHKNRQRKTQFHHIVHKHFHEVGAR